MTWRGVIRGLLPAVAALMLTCALAADKSPPPEKNSAEVEAVLRKAEEALRKENYREAAGLGESVMEKVQDPVPLLQVLARSYMGLGEVNDAIGLLRQALSLKPACVECAILLADLLGGVNELAKAREVLAKTLSILPDEPMLLEAQKRIGRGEVKEIPRPLDEKTLQRLEASKEDIERKIRNFSTKTGEQLLLEKNYEAAVQALQTELQDHPEDAERWTNLGVAQDGMGLYEKSAEAHRKALEFDPGFAIARNNLGHALEMLEEYAKAVVEYENAIALSSGYTLAMQNLANTYLKMGEVDDSIRVNQQAIKIDPNDSAPHNNLAFAWFKKGWCKAALASLREADRLEPGQPTVSENMGFIQDAINVKDGPCLKNEPEVVAVAPGTPPFPKEGPALKPVDPVITPVKPGPAPVKPATPAVKPYVPPPPVLEPVTAFKGVLVAGLEDGRVLKLTHGGKPQLVMKGRFPSAAPGAYAWLFKQDIGYGVAVKAGGKTMKLDTSPGYKRGLILSAGGKSLAWQTLGSGGGLKMAALGGKPVFKATRSPSFTWKDKDTLLVLTTGCNPGAAFDQCLKQMPLTGENKEFPLNDGRRNLYYAEGARLSSVQNGVFYAASPVVGGTLVKVDLNDSRVVVLRPKALEGIFDPASAIAQQPGGGLLALAIGNEIWVLNENGGAPLRLPVNGRIQTLDWVP